MSGIFINANRGSQTSSLSTPQSTPGGLFTAQTPPVSPDILRRVAPPFADATKALQAMQNLVKTYTNKAAASPLRTLSAKDQRAFESAAAALTQKFSVSQPTVAQKSQFNALRTSAMRINIRVPQPKPAQKDLVPRKTGAEIDAANIAKGLQQAGNATARLPDNKFRETSPALGGGVALPGYTRLKTAAPALLPVYASNNAALPNTYITLIDLKKVKLQPLVSPATSGASASATNPRPEYTSRSGAQWSEQANASGRALAVFNTEFFETDGGKSALSLPTAVNGRVVSAGKAESGATVALVWNNGTGSANIKQATIDPRLVNDRDGKHYLTYQAATRALDLKSGDNALVGFDPLKFEPNTLENSGATYAGVTAKGKMLVLSTNTAMTRAAAARELIKAGAEHVVMLDSGASSFLNVRGGDGQMNAAVRSDRNRLVPAAAAVYAR